MNDILLKIGLTAAGAVVPMFCIAFFAKKLPKDETFKKYFIPNAEFCAIFIHALCVNKFKLKPKTEKDIEEGIFLTLAYWLTNWIKVFIAKWNELIASSNGGGE